MRKLALLLIPALTTGVLTGLPPAAHAALDQVCADTEIITYSPPVTNTPADRDRHRQRESFQLHQQLRHHRQLQRNGHHPRGTCTNVLTGGPGTRVFTWTNPAIAPSTFTYDRIATLVNGTVQVEFLGEISSGTFTPDPAKQEVTGLVLNPIACLTTGVQETTFAGTVEIGL